MKNLDLPWGKDDKMELPLPDGWQVKSVLSPRHPQTLPDLTAELDRAMSNPIGLPRLREFARRNVCIVIDDRTRPTPVCEILPAVLGELLQAGIRDEDITILIALGTHREMTRDEIAARIGQEPEKRFRVFNHNYKDKKNLRHIGKTKTHGVPVSINRHAVETDTVVSIGCIEAHENAGFGGGYKNFMPGLADEKLIHQTHSQKFQKLERISLSGQPRSRCKVRQVIDECGALLGPKVFIVNAVLDPLRPVAIVAGEPIAAHQAGAEIYRQMAEVNLPEPAEAVIADASPLDIDLRVSMKAWFNAACALRPGGLFITVSRAEEGLGDLRVPESLPDGAKKFIKRMPLKLIAPLAMRINKSPDQAVGIISLLKTLKLAGNWLYLTTATDGIEAFKKMGIEFFTDAQSLMERAREIKPTAEAIVLPQAGASFISWS